MHDHAGNDIPVRTSDCLDVCSRANIVVVHPSAQGRSRGGRPVWFGDMTEDPLIEDLDDWIFEGGPGIAPVPESLVSHVTSGSTKKATKAERVETPTKSRKPKKDKKRAKAEMAVEAPEDTKGREAKKPKKNDKKKTNDKKRKKQEKAKKRGALDVG